MIPRCAICNRETTAPAGWLGGRPVGPVCARRAGLVENLRQFRESEAQRDDRTMDLFDGLKDSHC